MRLSWQGAKANMTSHAYLPPLSQQGAKGVEQSEPATSPQATFQVLVSTFGVESHQPLATGGLEPS